MKMISLLSSAMGKGYPHKQLTIPGQVLSLKMVEILSKILEIDLCLPYFFRYLPKAFIVLRV